MIDCDRRANLGVPGAVLVGEALIQLQYPTATKFVGQFLHMLEDAPVPRLGIWLSLLGDHVLFIGVDGFAEARWSNNRGE